MERLIALDRSVIVAADVAGYPELKNLAKAMNGVAGISAFKFGIEAGLDGLERSVGVVQDWFYFDVLPVYDHQKAGNDIPQMGGKFAKKLVSCGIKAAILFPFAGPKTQREWTSACEGEGLRVIVGGVMTHPEFLVSEGGYIADDTPERIFRLAVEQGVRDFVVPGNKIEWVLRLKGILDELLGEGNHVLYAPGLISQGGDVTECGRAAGKYFHGIIGSAIYERRTRDGMREVALLATSKLAVA